MQDSKEMLFEVDKNKCLKCGICVKDCAFGALGVGKDQTPVMKQPQNCMLCQHCFAICPSGAVTFDGIRPEEALEVESADIPTAQQMENWMKVRRSMRSFKDEDVDRALIEKLLKLLANSPTGCNARGLTFNCYPDRNAMNKFRKSFIKVLEEHRDGSKLLPRWLAAPAIKLRNGTGDMFFRGATGMLIVSCDETKTGVATPLEDVVIACSNFEHLANANGISTCWCGFLKLVQNEVPELLEKIVGIRRSTPFYAILFGKGSTKYTRGVERGRYAEIKINS
ncbi:MAG: nitroreductase family protein [Kiritimatiellae bacterium]|nr:nitroreductase family protein [Kiritimatiellia bacterium]